MFSSITSTCAGTAQAPRSSARWYAARASRTRKHTAVITGVSDGCTLRGNALTCELMMMFMLPCRNSSTSRERCRAIGRKPIVSSTWPSACGRLVAYSTNSMPSRPRGLETSTGTSRSEFMDESSQCHGFAPGAFFARMMPPTIVTSSAPLSRRIPFSRAKARAVSVNSPVAT